MKIAVAIAPENALPSAFVVFRGLEESIKKASELGYDGVELALREKRQVDLSRVKRLIKDARLEIPAISSGQIFADSKLWLSAKDREIRGKAIEALKGLIDVASEFGAMVNLGRVRGFVEEGETAGEVTLRFADAAGALSDYARPRGVPLLLEPVNRYETNFINSVKEGAELIDTLGMRGRLLLMPDVFHMNIEDASIEGALKAHIADIGYVHFADSNRLAPGWGHLDFQSFVKTLRNAGYDGWVSVEILPEPEPYAAASQAIKHLRQFIPRRR